MKRTACSKSLSVLIVVVLSALLAPLCLLANKAAADGLIVSTTTGKLEGLKRSAGGAEFLGIPYAQPPVGDLRWHEPLPLKPWTGVRAAHTFGAPCMQAILGDWNRRDAETSREDCLFLNVMTPAWPAKGLPVMVWLHGGANAGGTASSALYKDGTLVQHGVILVTVNYRLGVFGFLAHPALTRESAHHASGNYGLMDQIAALRWVRENIQSFGGDPGKVTLFGQSAGAQDTSLLMTSALSKDLFQAAIAQSGSAIMPPLANLADAERGGEKLAANFKAPADDAALKYLRQLSGQDLLKGLAVQDPRELPAVGPDVDGWVIQRSPVEVFAEGRQAPIPLLIGTTTREFGLSLAPADLRGMMQNVMGNLAGRTMTLYGVAGNGTGTPDPLYGSAADQWFADLVFRCPVTTQAAWHSAIRQPTYEYELGHAIPGQESQGAVHSADLPYVFGYYPKSGNISGGFGEIDFKLAELIETYWTNFAKSGNPNGAALPDWPEFGAAQQFIKFTQDGQVVKSEGLRGPQCELQRESLKHSLHR